jgi:hypothetical protein
MSKLSLFKSAAHSALAPVLAFVIVSTHSGSAQAQDHHADDTHGPLVLKEQGMFYVGGDVLHSPGQAMSRSIRCTSRSWCPRFNAVCRSF